MSIFGKKYVRLLCVFFERESPRDHLVAERRSLEEYTNASAVSHGTDEIFFHEDLVCAWKNRRLFSCGAG